MNYTELSESESSQIHKELLREPDENMILFSKRLLGEDGKSSLPIAFELLLIDKTRTQIMQELLDFYCKTSVIQYSLKEEMNLKRAPEPIPLQKKKRKI